MEENSKVNSDKKEEVDLTKNEQDIMKTYFNNVEFNKYFDAIWSPFKKRHKVLSKKDACRYFFVLGIESFKRSQEAKERANEETEN